MLFNSVIFITVFLPAALLGWFLLQRLDNPVFARAFIIGMSFWFYGYYNISYLWILLLSLAVNYGISALFERCTAMEAAGFENSRATGNCAEAGESVAGRGDERNRKLDFRKMVLVVGIGGNLGLLFYFKYFNFFIENCNFFLHTDIQLEKIALPLGISFFTFQQLSFIIERYRGNAPHYSILDYGFFVSFFPQLIAGPIVRHSELIPQLQKRENRYFSADSFYDGITLFILGMAKKVLLADSLAVLVNAEYDNIAALDTPSAALVICWYMMELYFDFSGYCDMARGIAGMFGFRLPENFNSPFRAASVGEFWRRWHMTLSRFLSQYVYIPMGGNRKGRARKCLNLMTVFLVSGIWHGANWTYVVWGLMHGLAVVFETAFPKARFRREWMNRMGTTVFVTLSFSIFRSESLEMAALLWKRLFTGGNTGMLAGVCNTLIFPENYALLKFLEIAAPGSLNIFFLLWMVILSALGVLFLRGCRAEQWIAEKSRSKGGIFVLASLFVWSFVSLSRVSVFLYFDF